MPDSLTSADPALNRITRTIVERFDPERILLFGSRAALIVASAGICGVEVLVTLPFQECQLAPAE